MYYAGVPTLVVCAKCPALISINGRVAGECGGKGYISVPLSANGDYYVAMQPLLPHDASGAALCPVTRRFSLENGIMEQTGYPDAVLCLWPGGVNEITMKPIAICAKAGKPCEKAGQKGADAQGAKQPINNLERGMAFAVASMQGKFDEAMKSLPKGKAKGSSAAQGLAYCNLLFKLEDSWAELTPEERYNQRLEQAKPVLDVSVKSTPAKKLPDTN